MAFQFTLEALLRYRRGVEHRERLRLAAIHRTLAGLRQQTEAFARQQTSLRSQLKQRMSGGVSMAELHEANSFETVAQKMTESLLAQIARHDTERAAQQERYLLAWKNCQVLEKLRERQRLAWQGKMTRRAQQELDEQALRRFRQAPASN